MLTPRFHLSQTDNTVTIYIRAPYCSLKELDVSVEENIFLFYCSPYYLRLHLPGTLVDNDNRKSSFDADTGEFTFTYEKNNNGEHFSDLNLITKLLCPKVDVTEDGQKIEVLSSDHTTDELESDSNMRTEYGFAMRNCYNFNLSSEFSGVIELDPRNIKLDERRKLKLQNEKEKFNSDHYLADLFENAEIAELKSLPVPWKNLKEADTVFNDKELDFLKDLPNKNYTLSSTQIQYCHNNLLEILFAYCYDRRTTYFEGTCESGWNISRISSSLCWFDGFTTPKEALISAFRRSLIFPLYREYDLGQKIFNDLKSLLQHSETYIIKCLINIYDIFLSGDNRFYIFNDLFIKDLIIYVMKWDKDLWKNTIAAVQNLKIDKTDLGLDLEQIEQDATLESLNTKLNSLCVCEQGESSDSDDSSDDYTSDYSETDSNSSDTTESST